MKKVFFLIPLILCGCTVLKIEQKDEDSMGGAVTTTIKATAWFSSVQNVTKLKALQTAKTQSFGTESFGQQGATNVVEALKEIRGILELITSKVP